MNNELIYVPVEADELAANISFLTQRAEVIGKMIDQLNRFQESLPKFDLDPEPANTLYTYLCSELLKNETERMVFKKDYEDEIKKSMN